jgi:hypothetical protein
LFFHLFFGCLGMDALFRINSETVNPLNNCSDFFRRSPALCLHRDTLDANSDLFNKAGK